MSLLDRIRRLGQPAPPPSISDAARMLSARAHEQARAAREKARASQNEKVRRHCLAILNSMNPQKELNL
jgi:hypothetical protein